MTAVTAVWHTTVVVVTHEGRNPRLRACLEALAADRSHDSVVVVDNGDGAVDAGSGTQRYGPGVDGVVTMPNRGYGAAANAGIAWARAHAPGAMRGAVALLNDDVTVRSGWLTPLLAALDAEPVVGAVQPKLVFSGSGRVNSLGVGLDPYFAGADVGWDEPDDVGDATTAVTACTGGAVVLRTELLDDVGGFDERYFLYYEDVDLALRGAAYGWEYRSVGSSVVDHHRGASTDRMGDARRAMQERNRLWCAARFADAPTMFRALGLSVRRLRVPPRRVHATALATGLAGMPVRLAERTQRCRR